MWNSTLVYHRNTSNATFDGYAPYSFWNDPRTWEAEIPSGNGITNSRSLAKIYASLISDVDCKKGERLLNETILQQAIKSSTRPGELDFVSKLPIIFAMGYILWADFHPPFLTNKLQPNSIKTAEILCNIIFLFFFNKIHEIAFFSS